MENLQTVKIQLKVSWGMSKRGLLGFLNKQLKDASQINDENRRQIMQLSLRRLYNEIKGFERMPQDGFVMEYDCWTDELMYEGLVPYRLEKTVYCVSWVDIPKSDKVT